MTFTTSKCGRLLIPADSYICQHLSSSNLLILCVILYKYRRALSFQNLRIYNKIHEECRRLSLAHIGANPMMASRGLIPGTAMRDNLHRILIHLIQNRATDHVSGDRSTPVTVRGCRTVRRIFDEHSDSGFPGAVDQFKLVSNGGRRQRTPSDNLGVSRI